MIGAARRPEPSLPRGMHRCPRCGIEYRDTSDRWHPVAPCADCREWVEDVRSYLTAKGDREWGRVGVKPKRSEAAKARRRETDRILRERKKLERSAA